MEYLFKHKRKIAIGLSVALVFSVVAFLPKASYVIADSTPQAVEANATTKTATEVTNDSAKEATTGVAEEVALEKKVVDPKRGAEFDGYIVSIKDSAIDEVESNETSGDFESSPSDKFYIVEEPEEVLEFSSASSIQLVEPNYVMHAEAIASGVPNDARYKYQKVGFEMMGINELYKAGLNGKGVKLAVFDTGHTKLLDMKAATRKINAVTNPAKATSATIADDKYGHGTNVSSIIASTTNNSTYLSGVADGVELTSVKVFADDGSGNSGSLLWALEYMESIGYYPDVVNMSLSGPGKVTSLQNKITKFAKEHNTIFLASTGNHGVNAGSNYSSPNQNGFPASYENVIGVGATNNTGVIANYSAKNSSVDVVAQGSNVFIVDLANKSSANSIYSGNGTSFSCPIVAGIAACMKQMDKTLNHDRFMNLIKTTSTDKGTAGRDNSYGYGIVNAGKMIKAFEYSINYNTNDGQFDVAPSLTKYKYSTTAIKLPTNLTKDGEYFKGWYLDAALTKGPYTSIPASTKGSLTYYAKWGTQTTVSFNSGTNATPIDPRTYDISGTSSDNTSEGDIGVSDVGSSSTTYGKLATPVKFAHTFGGWYYDSAYKTKVAETDTVDSYDRTLYAKWIPDSYKITLVLNGGSKVTKANVNYGSKIGSVASPKRSGYTFMGWYRDSKFKTKLSTSYVVTGNVTLYAKWLSSKATLKKLRPSTSKFTRSYAASRTSYTVTISRSRSSVRIYATKALSSQKVQMKIGSGKYKTVNSINVALSRGKAKYVYVKVIAPDGKTTKTYKVLAKRKR